MNAISFWWHRRGGSLLVYGTPAVAALAIVGWIGGRCLGASESRIAEIYRDRAQSSFDAKNFREALVCFERLAMLREPKEADLLGLVLTAEKLQMFERAASLLARLAPEERVGFAPAHLLLARRLLDVGDSNPTTLNLAIRHLNLSLESRPDAIDALRMLADVRERTGRLDEAVEALSRIPNRSPTIRMQKARLLVRQGKKPEGRAEAEAALKESQRFMESQPADKSARLAFGDAACFLERFADAETALREGLKIEDAVEYHRLIATVTATHALVVAQKGAVEERSRLLEESAAHDPDNALMINQVASMLEEGEQSKALAQRLLSGLSAKASKSAGLLFAKGVDAWLKGLRTEARRFWEESLGISPKGNESAAHLAWLLASDDPPNYERAAKLVERLLLENPGSVQGARIRDLIALRQNRFADALPVLDEWIDAHPSDELVRGELIRAYRKLGLESKINALVSHKGRKKPKD